MNGHPYANAWPMLGDDELRELADDIAANGQREPVVIYQGLILDGRNRAAACDLLGLVVESVEFDGDDDAALAFVQSVNNARRHQSKGSLAASWALSMLAADKRASGKWQFRKRQNSDALDRESRRVAGVIADYAADLLATVRDDRLTLNAAYEQAVAKRDQAAREAAEAAQREEEETEAREFIEREAPDLAERVDGDDFRTYSEALAVWEQRNREEAERLRKEKADAEREKAEREKALTDLYSGMARALQTLDAYGKYDDITELMGDYTPAYLHTPQSADLFSVPSLERARGFIDRLIQWKENQ